MTDAIAEVANKLKHRGFVEAMMLVKHRVAKRDHGHNDRLLKVPAIFWPAKGDTNRTTERLYALGSILLSERNILEAPLSLSSEGAQQVRMLKP